MSKQPPRRNVKLVIAYNGSAYHGWQRQARGFDTIQQRVEESAARVVRHPLSVSGVSRTDAGVHAVGQVANFHTTNMSIPLKGLRRAMNSILPRDIAILSAREVPHDFHASISALRKTYRYRIYVAPQRPVHLHGQVYHYWKSLDADRMRAAAVRLLGEHDFRGLATSAEVRKNTVRTIYQCLIAQANSEIIATVTGDGFLYNMVRNLIGTLIEIGRGRWQPGRIDMILASCDRRDAGPTAPPEGLYLMSVEYPAEATNPDNQ